MAEVTAESEDIEINGFHRLRRSLPGKNRNGCWAIRKPGKWKSRRGSIQIKRRRSGNPVAPI